MPACREILFSGEFSFGVMSERMRLLHCTLVGGIFISGLGDVVLTGGWMDG